MCGRFDLNETPQRLMAHFKLQAPPAPFVNDDVRPTNWPPIIRDLDGQRLALPARWGLIPWFAKDEKVGVRAINARAETVATLATFKNAFKSRRCIVPATAFYEWATVPGQKQKRKYRFTAATGEPLGIAGLWERWKRPGTDEVIESFTIITTTPNQLMAPIHERMPAVLTPVNYDAWLSSETPTDVARQLLMPAEEEVITFI